MKRDNALISGSDSAYYHLLSGLLMSLRRQNSSDEFDIYVFDCGLTDEQRRELTNGGVHVVTPRWDFPREVPGYIAMLAARPSIPDYFPGYETYLWMDADCWAQDLQALQYYRDGAQQAGFCATAEHPRFNWLCHTATPMVSEDGKILLEPVPPYTPLAVVHMTLWSKKRHYELQTPSGKTFGRYLTFDRELSPSPGTTVPDFSVSL